MKLGKRSKGADDFDDDELEKEIEIVRNYEKENNIFSKYDLDMLKKQHQMQKQKHQEEQELMKRSSSFLSSNVDHKERSKERKKMVEENRGKVDKRVNAMAELKARREGK